MAAVQPSEALVIVRLQALLHPVDPVRRQHLGHLDGVALGPRHPAIEHDVAIGAQQLARALHQFDVLLHALAAVGRAVRNRQLQPLEAELDVLLDVVARAVGGNARLGLAAEQTCTPACPARCRPCPTAPGRRR